jgi:hypothetical protein
MSKYIQSFNDYESDICGVFIPRRYYNLAQQNRGKKPIIEVSDAQLDILEKDKIYQAMIKKGSLKVLDVIPEAFMDIKAKYAITKEENTALKKKLAIMQKKLQSFNAVTEANK